MSELAICEKCFKRTLNPKLSMELHNGQGFTLCPECASREKEYFANRYREEEEMDKLLRHTDDKEIA